MIDKQRKIELLGDKLVSLLVVEFLIEELKNVSYNRFYGGFTRSLEANKHLGKMALSLGLQPIESANDDKALGSAFETYLGDLYLKKGIDVARHIFFETNRSLIDMDASLKTFSPMTGITLMYKN